jgi:hypothetical protein
MATHSGAAKYDGFNWKVFNKSNSGLPADIVTNVAIGRDGTAWFGMLNDGVVKYDGTAWTIYNSRNSGLTSNIIEFIVIDSTGTKWIGTRFDGLFSFDDIKWIKHTNGDFFASIYESAWAFAIDRQQYNWVGTAGRQGYRLAKFKDASWIAFDSTVIGFRFDIAYHGIAIDKNNVKWLAGRNGFVKYDEVTWKLYSANNSPIRSAGAIIVDRFGNKVFAATLLDSSGALAFFNETGVITSINEERDARPPKDFALLQNYPNPFNPATIIKFAVTKTGFATLKVYNTLGQEVAVLFSGIAEGNRIYQATLNAATLPSGFYFARLRFGSQSAVRKMVLVDK